MNDRDKLRLTQRIVNAIGELHEAIESISDNNSVNASACLCIAVSDLTRVKMALDKRTATTATKT